MENKHYLHILSTVVPSLPVLIHLDNISLYDFYWLVVAEPSYLALSHLVVLYLASGQGTDSWQRAMHSEPDFVHHWLCELWPSNLTSEHQ
jgi:hypothetical protein